MYVQIHEKNNFTRIPKNLARYRSENNFAVLLYKLCRKLKYDKKF